MPVDPSSEASSGRDLLEEIEIVEDRTEDSRCDVGFLKLQRLIVRNRYESGRTSETYPCDIVRRPSPDAVAIVLHRTVHDGERPRIVVVVREAPRVPVFLRRYAGLVIPDPQPYTTLVELVAGLIEPSDAHERGLETRAAAEAREEAGYAVDPDRVVRLGEGSFASPGITDEKVFFAAAPVDGIEATTPEGDGSVMEEGTREIAIDLRDAIRRCRDGRIPDLKTEVGLYRLADAIGYLPSIDRFAHELELESDDLGAGRIEG